MHRIEFAASVIDEMAKLKARDRTAILDKIEEQLTQEPTRATRNKKIIVGLEPPWEHETPMWELRAGQFRVFYDVNDEESIVVIRAVRHKPPHKSTEEIL